MSRLNQLYPSDYPSQEKISAEFAALYAFLIATERGGMTLAEQLAQIFTVSGEVSSTLIEFQATATHLQYRRGGGSWVNLVALSTITGPAGASGAGTGDMVRATYDPNADGKIAYSEMLFADGDIPQAKIASLVSDLKARVRATVSTTEPVSPTYPPAGPIDFWLDISNAAAPVWKWWDGVGSWRSFSSTTTTATDTTKQLQVLAGEGINSRDLVFLAPIDDYGASLISGGTPFASAGTAANAFDGSTGTSCDTASTSGHIGYQFASAQSVGLVEITWAAASVTHALVFEVSANGSTYTTVGTVAVATYDGNYKSVFKIASPSSALYFRVRQTGGATNMIIREMVLYSRSIDQGRAYKVDADANAPARMGRVIGIAQEAGATNNRFKVLTQPGLVTDMSGLTSATVVHSSTTAGGLTATPSAKSVPVGEAKDATTLNFHPQVNQNPVGSILMFAGSVANLPHGFALCDGTLLERARYADLFAKIATSHGAGDGQTTFAIPDLRDRFIVAAKQDDSSVAKTNLTGGLTQSGGSRTSDVTTGGGGANLSGVTSAMQVTVDPPYYALAFAVRVW